MVARSNRPEDAYPAARHFVDQAFRKGDPTPGGYAIGEALQGKEDLTEETFEIVKSQPEYRS